MAIRGTWKSNASLRNQTLYGGPLKQGTGWNAVHGYRAGAGRGIAHGALSEQIDPSVTDEFAPENLGYMVDSTESLIGYGAESATATGMADRPAWQEDSERVATLSGYPSWGDTIIPPEGTMIRAHDHGSIASLHANGTPNEDVAQGWRNKPHGKVNDAETSNPSQYEIQTSMVQRDAVRAGSQRGAGSDSSFMAPIRSRIVGVKLKYWSGEQRHDDMRPKVQEQIIRPFWLRTAGTGNIANMAPNTMYASEPLQRTPPEDAYQGGESPASVASGSYGFTGEDVTY